jgi:hypothetical protein
VKLKPHTIRGDGALGVRRHRGKVVLRVMLPEPLRVTRHGVQWDIHFVDAVLDVAGARRIARALSLTAAPRGPGSSAVN